MEWVFRPWPWFVAGPIIGLFVPALLLGGNKLFGVSSNLRHLCSAIAPGRIAYFNYDWQAQGRGTCSSSAASCSVRSLPSRGWGGPMSGSPPETRASLTALGLLDLSGFGPREVFSWPALLSAGGFVSVVVGGFLVGFGTAYAGGCTSGHAIAGLADLQLPSLLAVAGFFGGGLIATHWIIPLLL